MQVLQGSPGSRDGSLLRALGGRQWMGMKVMKVMIDMIYSMLGSLLKIDVDVDVDGSPVSSTPFTIAEARDHVNLHVT
jgi:hypothetical protein